jgi:cytochrome c553
VLRVGVDGTISRRDALPSPTTGFVPHVAWRAVAGPSGTVVTLHQAESTTSLVTTVQGGYGCGGGTPGGDLTLVDVVVDAGVAPDDGGSSPSPSAPDEDASGNDGGVAEGGLGVFTACPLGVQTPGGSLPSTTPMGLPLPVSSPPPGGGCQGGGESGAVLGVLTVLGSDGTVLVNVSIPAVLPVDVAVSPDGSSYAVVAAGNAFVSTNLNTVLTFDRCGNSSGPGQVVGTGGVSEQPIAVAYDAAGDLLVQTREPAALWILGSTGQTAIALSSATRADTGFDIFHAQAGGMIACASCHPEGRDDGHVWILDGDKRRTPSLRGTIAGTAPYHWPGDEPTLNVLVNDVYTVRMDGAPLNTAEMGAITGWVQNVAAPPAPSWVDAASADRGKALFESAAIGCATCHSGAKFTNNLTMDVGTGGAFQVPPLVGVGWRTPLMHDGCATTLADRFGACATPQHGSTGTLSQQNVSDLIAYLETL